MDVQLYVYDLSRGLARQFSGPLLGFQIDAVYHTSVVVQGVEYFYGMGVQTSHPGMTHHGHPMEIVPLGRTELPMEVILEYMESLKETYTAEAYDLFLHNCNNFSNDLSQFLVGRGIPDKIVNLPQDVLNTPFGQMLKPQLDSMMRPVVQAPSMGAAPSRMPPSGPSNSSVQAGKDTTPSFLSSNKLFPSPYAATPPLAKLTPQLPSSLQAHPAVTGIVKFLETRAANPRTPQEAAAPDMRTYDQVLSESLAKWQDGANGNETKDDQMFPLLDLLRAALVDSRCVAQFVEPTPSSINGRDKSSGNGRSGIEFVLIPLLDKAFPPNDTILHSLHVTILRIFVNLLGSPVPLSIRLRLLHGLRDRDMLGRMVHLTIEALTRDPSTAIRAQAVGDAKKAAGRERMAKMAAAKLAWAIAGIYHGGADGKDAVPHELRVEILAAAVEALKTMEDTTSDEDKAELRDALVRTIGLLCHVDEAEGVWDYRDLCDAFDVKALLRNDKALEVEVRKTLG